MCFVLGSGWKHLDLEQYRISGLTPSTLPTVGNCSHMDGEVMEGGWSGDDDDDGDDLPSPEAKTTSRLALPEKNRGWRGLRDENWENDFCFGVSPSRE